MPKRFKKRRAVKRRFKRGRKNMRKMRSRATIKVVKSPTVVPDRLRTKLKYQIEVVPSMSPAGTTVYYQIAGNDLYRPVATSTHTAYGVNQWGTLYSRFRIFGSSISVRPGYGNAAAATGTGGTYYCIIPHSNNGNLTFSTPLNEMPYFKMNQCSPGSTNGMLKHYMSTAKIYGEPNKAVSIEDGYENTINSATGGQPQNNLVNKWYWQVCFAPIISADAITNLAAIITLEYYVEWSLRWDMASSISI